MTQNRIKLPVFCPKVSTPIPQELLSQKYHQFLNSFTLLSSELCSPTILKNKCFPLNGCLLSMGRVKRQAFMPLEKRSEGSISEGVNSPLMSQVVSGTVPDFKRFHIHRPTFLWQLRCFVEETIKKRLSGSFIHNSSIDRLNANSSCFSPWPKTISNFPAAVPFVIVVSFLGN